MRLEIFCLLGSSMLESAQTIPQADPEGGNSSGQSRNLSGQVWYRILYLQVILAVIVGILLGVTAPEFAKGLKPLGDAFIKLVKMMIAPIVFCTIVHGIASVGDLKRLGRVGFRTLVYFEIVSTFALLIGLIVVNILRPGEGITPKGQAYGVVDPSAGSTTQTAVSHAESVNTVDFILGIIPKSFIGAFVGGDLLQVLLISILTAIALTAMDERGQPLISAVDQLSQLFFQVMNIVVKFAPLGALGAMAYTVAAHGIGMLGKLLALMLGFYLTAAIFVCVVLGAICWYNGFSIWRLLVYFKDEILLIIGTSSSETALPGLLTKARRLGCRPGTVGLVVPTGYSFNLDGTNIYLTMAAIFLAQATNTDLSWQQQLSLLAVGMITSKGASGVTGAGFVTLAATLQAVPSIPIESVALLVGIDRFMSECRAVTNFIGNAVATLVISRWEGEVSTEQLCVVLSNSDAV
jgi:aerobic C4-dicarboxylate transport protein